MKSISFDYDGNQRESCHEKVEFVTDAHLNAGAIHSRCMEYQSKTGIKSQYWAFECFASITDGIQSHNSAACDGSIARTPRSPPVFAVGITEWNSIEL